MLAIAAAATVKAGRRLVIELILMIMVSAMRAKAVVAVNWIDWTVPHDSSREA